jgi:hypothetical protein
VGYFVKKKNILLSHAKLRICQPVALLPVSGPQAGTLAAAKKRLRQLAN